MLDKISSILIKKVQGDTLCCKMGEGQSRQINEQG